jgi:hypothetical protein
VLVGGFGLDRIVSIVGGNGQDTLFFGFFGLMLLGGAAAVYFGVRSIWFSHLLGVPTLIIPAGEALCLGGVVVAQFVRSGGTARAQYPPRLSAELICEESVSYQQGTDTSTATREIRRHQLEVAADDVPGKVSGRVMIKVPVDAPPSLELSHNRIMWSVTVGVRVVNLPDDSGRFKVKVLPVVAGRVVGEGGRASR